MIRFVTTPLVVISAVGFALYWLVKNLPRLLMQGNFTASVEEVEGDKANPPPVPALGSGPLKGAIISYDNQGGVFSRTWKLTYLLVHDEGAPSGAHIILPRIDFSALGTWLDGSDGNSSVLTLEPGEWRVYEVYLEQGNGVGSFSFHLSIDGVEVDQRT